MKTETIPRTIYVYHDVVILIADGIADRHGDVIRTHRQIDGQEVVKFYNSLIIFTHHGNKTIGLAKNVKFIESKLVAGRFEIFDKEEDIEYYNGTFPAITGQINEYSYPINKSEDKTYKEVKDMLITGIILSYKENSDIRIMPLNKYRFTEEEAPDINKQLNGYI